MTKEKMPTISQVRAAQKKLGDIKDVEAIANQSHSSIKKIQKSCESSEKEISKRVNLVNSTSAQVLVDDRIVCN